MTIYELDDPVFHEYGRVIKGYPIDGLLKAAAATPCPEKGTVYFASAPVLEAAPEVGEIARGVYGFMPIQVGCCNGHNTKLNGLEYHRDSEINIPVDGDIILLLARRAELSDDFHLDTAKVKAFRVPKGTMVEIFATTLHYAPCGLTAEDGFRVIVILPKGTNAPLAGKAEVRDGEEKLMTAVNKWLIGHADGGCAEGTFIGLDGDNPDVTAG